MQRVEVRTDHVGVEQWRKAAVANQHRHLAQRILRKHRLVPHRRARLVVNDLDAIRKTRLVREHEGFASIGRMSLVEQFHGRGLWRVGARFGRNFDRVRALFPRRF